MERNQTGLLSGFVASQAVCNNVCIDREGSIIVDSLKSRKNSEVFKIDTTLLSIGNMDVHDINVKGNLICKGYMNTADLFVKGNLTCEDNANIGETEVLGDFICHGNMHSNGYKVVVHGDFLCEGNCNADLIVRGKFNCKGEYTGKYMPMW